eukprot:2278545-Amphidinium_carterae.2
MSELPKCVYDWQLITQPAGLRNTFCPHLWVSQYVRFRPCVTQVAAKDFSKSLEGQSYTRVCPNVVRVPALQT